MLGVIGVVILVTILFLMLRATTRLEEPLPEMRAAATTMEFPSNPERVVRVRDADASTRAERRARVLELNTELEETEARIEGLQRELRLIVDDQALSGDAARMSRLVDQLADLEAKLGGLRKRNRLTYLMSEPDDLRPLVVELSSNRAVISRESSASNPSSIRGATIEETARRTVDFALAEKKAGEYLLMVVKPSGIPLWTRIVTDRRIQTLPVGLDLIPEHAATTDQFPGSNP